MGSLWSAPPSVLRRAPPPVLGPRRGAAAGLSLSFLVAPPLQPADLEVGRRERGPPIRWGGEPEGEQGPERRGARLSALGNQKGSSSVLVTREDSAFSVGALLGT